MTAFLDGISSLEYWRFCASASNSASAVCRNNRYANETYSKAKISTTDIDTISLALPKLSKPYHFLSAGPDLRTRSKQAQSRIAKASDIPPGSFIKIGKGLYACSPELCFCRLALLLDPIELAKIGFELSGFYRKTADNGAIGNAPLTKQSKLAEFSERYSGSGCVKARKTAPLVLDSSASPMETSLALMLTLAKSAGGFGLPRPRLNCKISKGRASHHSVYGQAFYCDLYWPEAQVAIEYDSDSFHTASAKIEHDARRRNALASLGITVITATKNQVNNIDGLNQLASQTAKQLGVRLRLERVNKQAQAQLLRDALR